MKFFKRFFNLTNKNKTYKLPENWTETNISADTFVTNIPKICESYNFKILIPPIINRKFIKRVKMFRIPFIYKK